MNEHNIESLKHISSEHRKLLTQRIAQEWKVVVLVLTFYAALASVQKFEITIEPMVIYAAASISSLISSMFLYYLHQANVKNKIFAENAETALSKFVDSGTLNYEHPSDKKLNGGLSQRNFLAWIWQSAIIISFAYLSANAAIPNIS